MPETRGYIKPLLTNYAVDYAESTRQRLVAPILFPRVPVDKPGGFYPYFGRDAFVIEDTTMANNGGRARLVNDKGDDREYLVKDYGLSSPIDRRDLKYMDGPFRRHELRKTRRLIRKIEMDQERRVASLALNQPGRFQALGTTGDLRARKWSGGGGDPYEAIKYGIGRCFWRPNTMVIQETVFDVLESHPKLIERLGENNLLKVVNEQTLAQLFRLDRVIIASGRADFSKKRADGQINLAQIWADSVVLAYVSEDEEEPRAGTTFMLRNEAANTDGYVVRTWDDESIGMNGGEYVFVGMEAEEKVVAPDLLWAIKSVL